MCTRAMGQPSACERLERVLEQWDSSAHVIDWDVYFSNETDQRLGEIGACTRAMGQPSACDRLGRVL